jgi:hypothetical protein
MSLFSSPHPCSAAAPYEYKNVRLVEDRAVDLHVYNSGGRGLWSNDAWLEEGRPRELSRLNLATWSLLTTSIREYQTGVRRYQAKMVLRMILPIYALWFGSLFIVDLEGVHTMDAHWIVSYYMTLIALIIAAGMFASHLRQKHVEQNFHPAVQSVLQELNPKLIEAGFEVQYMVQEGQWFPRKPSKSFLRFTPLPDEEATAAANRS